MGGNVTLIPYQHVVTVVRLTSGSVNGTAICKITEVIFLFYSIAASIQWSGYVLPRAAPQGRFMSIREYLRYSNEVNVRLGKHDLEERLNGGCSGEEESKEEMERVFSYTKCTAKRKRVICSLWCWLVQEVMSLNCSSESSKWRWWG